MTGELKRFVGRVAPAACASDGVPGRRAQLVSRALMRFAFALYVSVVCLSALGLSPLGSRPMASGLLVLSVLIGVASSGLWGRWRAVRVSVDADGLCCVGTLTFAFGCAALVASVGLALWLPVGAYDALGYRLPAVAQWLDAGRVTWVTGDDPLRNGYPLGLEVIEAVLFRAFDTPASVDAVAGVFVLAGALALVGAAGTFALPGWAGRFSGGLFLLVPMQLLNASSGYADAAFAGALVTLFVGSTRWALAEPFKKSLATVVDVGVAAALVIALKPHGFALAAIALAGGAVWRVGRVGVLRTSRELAVVGVLSVSGLFFALRNVMHTGNPLYPLEVRVGERLWFAGESSLDGILTPSFNVPVELTRFPSWLRPFWVWFQPHGPARSFDDRLAGFGYAFLLFGLPALGWVLWQALYQAKQRRDGQTGVGTDASRALLFVTSLTLACLLVQPFAFWPRFTSWVWGAAALALAAYVADLVRRNRATHGLCVALGALLCAVPEALYALVHVKGLDRFGVALLRADALTQLVRVSGIDADFVTNVLLGKHDVCRTPWRLGTDDANLDGVVAQLTPRPRMHVIDDSTWGTLAASVRAHGCDALIVIGDNPLVARVPEGWAQRVTSATAFGRCHLIAMSSTEVTP